MKGLGLSAGVCVMLGCNAVNPSAPRVTDQLRTTCYWLSDGEIESLLSDVADAREQGGTKAELVQQAASECADTSDVDGCNDCFNLAIDAMYD
jgi:hypothetical protein